MVTNVAKWTRVYGGKQQFRRDVCTHTSELLLAFCCLIKFVAQEFNQRRNITGGENLIWLMVRKYY